MGPLMSGLFTGETRLNLGEYEGESSPPGGQKEVFRNYKADG